MNRVTSVNFESVTEINAQVKSGPVKFINCNLSGMDLRSVSLDDCVFDSCEFIGTRLGYARRAKFYSCNLSKADFSCADITGAYALNCKADKLRLAGAKITVGCDFLSGIKTEHDTDIWKLIYLIALVDSPLKKELLDLIPEKAGLVIDLQFDRMV